VVFLSRRAMRASSATQLGMLSRQRLKYSINSCRRMVAKCLRKTYNLKFDQNKLTLTQHVERVDPEREIVLPWSIAEEKVQILRHCLQAQLLKRLQIGFFGHLHFDQGIQLHAVCILLPVGRLIIEMKINHSHHNRH